MHCQFCIELFLYHGIEAIVIQSNVPMYRLDLQFALEYIEF